MDNKKCKKCGNINNINSKYCAKCGHKFLSKNTKIKIVICFIIFIVLITLFSFTKYTNNKKEKEIINIRSIEAKEKIETYLKEKYSKETFNVVYDKSEQLMACSSRLDATCISYKKVKGKYKHKFIVYDSKGLEFDVIYEEEYEDNEEEIKEKYIYINTINILPDNIKKNVKELANKYNIEYNISEDDLYNIYSGAREDGTFTFRFLISIYENNSENVDNFINDMNNYIWNIKNILKNEKYIKCDIYYYSIFIIKDKNLYNDIGTNFKNLRMCKYNERSSYDKYFCKETNNVRYFDRNLFDKKNSLYTLFEYKSYNLNNNYFNVYNVSINN